MKKENNHKCCICGKDYGKNGNNPAPIKDRGKCCDECNYTMVIPSRIRALRMAYNMN